MVVLCTGSSTGRLCCRQEIIDFREGNKQDGTPAWHIDLRAEVIPVEISFHRPFQGWRYLESKVAPKDTTHSLGSANPTDDEISACVGSRID